MPKGQVSEVLSADAVRRILNAIGVIQQQLPFLVILSPEERKGILKLGPKSVKFVSSVKQMAQANPGMVPPAYDAPEFVRDVVLGEALDEFAPQLSQLAEAVSDTRMVAGSEAMTTALLLYGVFKGGRKVVPGLDGAVAEMGARFKRRPYKASKKGSAT